MRIGIFGGTFDPPHVGHLILAAEARAQLELDRLLWVLTADPPHKRGQPLTPLADRLDMVAAALCDNPAFELSRVDIDRPPPHYALDTVRLLQELYPQAALIYVMGGDSLHDLPTWHRAPEFLRACAGLGVMRRFGYQADLDSLERKLPGVMAKVEFIDAPVLEISSSGIRQRIRSGAPFRYYLPLTVYHLILERHLYRSLEKEE